MILASWPAALQYQLSALRFVYVLFFFCFVLFCIAVLSSEPKQKQERGLVDNILVQPPSPHPQSNFIAGHPKAAFLFWFFGDLRCGMLLFIVILVIVILYII